MGVISQEQFARIVERAGDVERRSYTSGTEAAAKPVEMNGLAEDLRRHGAPGAQGLVQRVGGMLGAFGGVVAMGPDGPLRFGGSAPAAKLPPPPDAARIAAAEQRYHELTREPYGPVGQDWPPSLLPLFEEDPVLICVDLDDGGIVAWDPEELEDEDSDEDWQRSFIRRHDSLSALIDGWLSGPTLAEDTERMLGEAMEQYRSRAPSPVTGFPMELGPRDQAQGEIVFLGYSPDLRKDFGLPEVGWEEEIRRRHGLT